MSWGNEASESYLITWPTTTEYEYPEYVCVDHFRPGRYPGPNGREMFRLAAMSKLITCPYSIKAWVVMLTTHAFSVIALQQSWF